MLDTPNQQSIPDELSLSRPGGAFAQAPAASRRRLPRAPSVLAGLLILAGTLLLADAGITLFWQEPISALYAQLKQDSLGGDLRALDSAPPAPAARLELARLHEERRRIAYLAGALQRQAR